MKKELYERILDLRDRISLDGDDTIYEEDYLLLDEVLDLIENIGGEDTDSVTEIGRYAFYSWNTNNQPIVIPNSVTSIGDSAFSYWNYNSTDKDEVELANAINVILPKYVKQEKLLELYRKYFNVTEHWYETNNSGNIKKETAIEIEKLEKEE